MVVEMDLILRRMVCFFFCFPIEIENAEEDECAIKLVRNLLVWNRQQRLLNFEIFADKGNYFQH